MTKKVCKIWCNNLFTEAHFAERDILLTGIGKHQIFLFPPKNNGIDGDSKQALLEADIAFGWPDPDTLLDCERLRWLQLNSAGYTLYDREDLKHHFRARNIVLTNSSAVYSEPCAEHLLAMMLTLARGLPVALDAQRGDRAWVLQELRPTLYTLHGQTVMLFGFGAIAQRLAELLLPFKMNIIGVRRKSRFDEIVRIIDEAEADQLLPQADHVINILPLNQTTDNYFSSERLSRLKSTALFYNIGRGQTVDQDFLIKQLENGRLAAAYLDVTTPEPLPPEHPLWTTPNCFITPHVAGGSTNEKARQVEHFLNNLQLFESGNQLLDRIV